MDRDKHGFDSPSDQSSASSLSKSSVYLVLKTSSLQLCQGLGQEINQAWGYFLWCDVWEDQLSNVSYPSDINPNEPGPKLTGLQSTPLSPTASWVLEGGSLAKRHELWPSVVIFPEKLKSGQAIQRSIMSKGIKVSSNH